ncbi:hypothetical protein OG21DRAFT_914015 [Imleria badia]|nr:hypothetical protein OG21DRAFT_914015 [Imleria badia]
MMVQKAVSCTKAYHAFHATSSSPYFGCSFLRSLSISEMAVGAVADTIAVVFPLYVLRGVTLPRKQLRLLRLLFLSNILVLIVCCIRIASQLVPALMHWSIFITNLWIATCLVVCNLLVVATYLYRVLKRQRHRTSSDTTEKDPTVNDLDLATPRQITLTTIDLLFSTQSEEGTEVATVS